MTVYPKSNGRVSVPEPGGDCLRIQSRRNWGENYADEIDWRSARVQEKIDGSIVKLWFNAKGRE